MNGSSRPYRTVLAACFLFFISTLLHADPVIAPGTSGTIDLPVADPSRSYRVHVPRGYAADKPAPVVLMLHGAGRNPLGTESRYGWVAESDAEGFVAIFPEATTRDADKPYSFLRNPRVWNDGSGWAFAGRRNAAERPGQGGRIAKQLFG